MTNTKTSALINNNPTFAMDNYLDYFAVVEAAVSSEDTKIKILKEATEAKDGLNFLRFSACLQTFGARNRNRRLWLGQHMKAMLQAEHVQELLQKSGIPGENGHPIATTGQVSIERILTIDPNNLSHRILSFEWKDDNTLYGVVETLDEGPGSAGIKFMRNIMQGMDPSFSVRTLVPQRKNADGSIDVTGPGRYVTNDRVIVPSHKEAYIDKSIPIKNISTKPQYEHVMESFTDFILEASEKVNRIIDKLDPAVETMGIDANGIVSINTEKEGRLFIMPESKYRNEFKDVMGSLF